MENKEVQKQIVNLLVSNEEGMQYLYEAYAKKFLGYGDFWKGIAKEEESHAAWIRRLYDKMKAGMADFAERRFPVDALQKSVAYLEEEKKKVDQGEMSLLYALETAVHIERGMLEHKFFEVFAADSIELQTVLEALQLGTQQHLQEVQKMWEKEKSLIA
ncbi:MAG: hypothetical protein WC238_00045 [Parcubacteria group bacterium]|jgi:hypothetical protein